MIVPSLRGGGLERLARDLVLSLDGTDFEPAVFCMNGLGIYADELTASGVEVRLSSDVGFRVRGVPSRLIRDLRAFCPDVIHAHSGTWLPAAVARRVLRYPKLVFTDHGRYPPEPRTRAIVERWCYRQTDAFVAVSPALAEYVRDYLRLDHLPEVALNGVDLASYGADRAGDRVGLRADWGLVDSDVLLLSAGRFVPVKNHDMLLRAFAVAHGMNPALRLALAGSGGLEAQLRALAEELGIADRVLFLGFRADIAACMNAADIFVISSLTEGLPVVLLEALAAGLPVVSTSVGGIPATLGDPPAGLLVDPDDRAAFASALELVGVDPSLRATLAARALERAQQFSLGAFTSRYERLYRDVLSRSIA